VRALRFLGQPSVWLYDFPSWRFPTFADAELATKGSTFPKGVLYICEDIEVLLFPSARQFFYSVLLLDGSR